MTEVKAHETACVVLNEDSEAAGIKEIKLSPAIDWQVCKDVLALNDS